MNTQREQLIKEAHRRLGGGIVRIELSADHYDDALNQALATYRQRSSNSVEERLVFLELIPDQTSYQLPKEIVEVRQIFRRSMGGAIQTGGDDNFEPFSAQISNQIMLGGAGSTNQGGLVAYELFTGFQELVGRMFGAHLMFTWHHTKSRLDIVRRPKASETVMLWVYNYRVDDDLLVDTYARPWLLRYTVAYCKLILGDARSKFATIGGPQGGTSLNGDAMKSEGQQEIDNLLMEISNQVDQNMGYGFLIG